jgi:hypothetical protein
VHSRSVPFASGRARGLFVLAVSGLTRCYPRVVRAHVVSLALLAAGALSMPARAESRASATGKGTAAGALLGAEAVMLTEAAMKVRSGWAYAVGGLAGAAGGAVGGYFLEGSASPRLNIYLFAAGMGLVIPTAVAVLATTAYEPPVEYTEDQGPIDEPVAEPPEATLDMKRSDTLENPTLGYRSRHPASAPAAVLGWSGDRWTLAVPAISIGDVFTPTERSIFGVDRETEVLVSIWEARF